MIFSRDKHPMTSGLYWAIASGDEVPFILYVTRVFGSHAECVLCGRIQNAIEFFEEEIFWGDRIIPENPGEVVIDRGVFSVMTKEQ